MKEKNEKLLKVIEQLEKDNKTLNDELTKIKQKVMESKIRNIHIDVEDSGVSFETARNTLKENKEETFISFKEGKLFLVLYANGNDIIGRVYREEGHLDCIVDSVDWRRVGELYNDSSKRDFDALCTVAYCNNWIKANFALTD